MDTIPAITSLEQINIPTYIIVGNQDAKDIDLIAKTYDQRLPDSKLIVMDGVAHLLTMENPTEFNRIFREILNE